jgi:DNA replication protein DnaC
MPVIAVSDERCPLCGGRGWVVEADSGAGAARPCACREQERSQRMVDAAGIPPRYRNCKISNFQTSSQSTRVRTRLEAARKITQDYVDNFILHKDQGFRESGLLFIGPPGVGKTHLAVGVLNEVVERYRVHGRFVEFTALTHQIQATFDPGSPESKREILDPLLDAELLVLDELGAQKPTAWVRDILYLIINHRYTRRLPTLFTTNYLLDPPAARGAARGVQDGEAGPMKIVSPLGLDRGRDPEPAALDESGLLATRLPSMLVSRLYEMAQPVALTGVEDFRREHKAHGTRLR